VTRLGSFTRAAEKTFRTQSAVSQQIGALEDELGCKLLERIGRRKLVLTPAGEKFLEFCGEVTDRRRRLLDELKRMRGLPAGSLKLAAPFTTFYQLFPGVLQEYLSRFPQVEVGLFDRPQHEVTQLVKSGEVDFGLVLESIAPDTLTKRRWKQVEPCLMTPAGHPLTRLKKVSLEDIARHPLILPPKSLEFSSRRALEKLLAKAGLEYRVVMESSNVELSSVYVEMGLGVSFANIVRDLPLLKQRKLAFISLGHIFRKDHIAVVMRKDRTFPAHKEALLKLLPADRA